MPKVLFVGCGKMGSALLHGIVAAQAGIEIAVVKPTAPSVELKSLPGVVWHSAYGALDRAYSPDAIIIAVKPQAIANVLPPYARFTNAVFLSVAVGTTLAKLASVLQNTYAAIVRTMPNLPVSVGKGMTAAVANDHVAPAQHELCDQLLRATGLTTWLNDEALIDTVAALSGSGPAYVFALCEAMAKAGEALGLSASIASQMARQTIVGSGALLDKATESADELRRAVTSPKGTTEAALAHLLADNGLNKLMRDAMAAAVARAKDLAR